jgi:hypothetical protein
VIAGSNPAEGMDVRLLYLQKSRTVCVCVCLIGCDLETSTMRRPWPDLFCCATGNICMAGALFPRDKVVGISNRLRIGQLRNLGSPTGSSNESSLLESVQPFPGAQPTSYVTYSAV